MILQCRVGNLGPSELALPREDLVDCGFLGVDVPFSDLCEFGVVEEEFALFCGEHYYMICNKMSRWVSEARAAFLVSWS